MKVNEQITEMMAKMVLQSSYWGYLFSRITRRAVSGDIMPYPMGVALESDGMIVLWYRPDLIGQLQPEDVGVLLEHEGLHLLHKHIPRLIRIIANEFNENRKRTKTMVWNIASDCCNNSMMASGSIRKKFNLGGHVVSGVYPEDFKLPKNKVAEYYYTELLKRMPEACPKCSGEGREGEQIQQSQGGGKSEGESNKDQKNGLGSSQGRGCPYCSRGFDSHSNWVNKLNEVSDLTSLARKAETNTESIIRDSLHHFQKKRGNLPGYLQELIDQALQPPKVPYYQIIRRLVKASRMTKFDRCLTRINRKRGYLFTLTDDLSPVFSPFPGKKRDYSFYVGILIDTSGSMSKEDILDGLSSVKNLLENDRHTKITVIENDTKVQKEYNIKRLRDIQFNVKGRGGTTLGPGLLRMKELETDVVLGFTDGYTEDINQIRRKYLPKKIIWCVSERGQVTTINKTGYIVRT